MAQSYLTHLKNAETLKKDPLMTYEKAFFTQSRGREIPELD